MTNTKAFIPETADSKIKALEARLRKVEATARVGVGTYQLNGLDIPIFKLDADEGLSLPPVHVPLYPNLPGGGVTWNAGNYATLTNGSMLNIWFGSHWRCHTDALAIAIPWATDAATTGEIQVQDYVEGLPTTSTITLPAGSSGVQAFNWKHSQPIGTGPFQPAVNARRASGAGNVSIFAPYYCYMIGSSLIGATATGV